MKHKFEKRAKTLITLSALLVSSAITFSVSAAAPQKDVRFVGETQFAGFCKAIVNDDIKVLRSSLSRNVGRIGASQREVLRMVTSEEGLTCNGSSLIEFSVERDANAVYEYLTSRS
ncbi:DUF3718 domain-containing protein [Alteromonas sp. 009811495]|uniref:DUF3718 domain-containing protein n=1 Tax=Alteromonas sp. 009811495 TaxID=3002962 RepID=UPI00237E8187|nr:DUF3718 domain-containing protein [Alteromonas sp. 009811495]WDT87813.1 DUF3718 domain-containing protein [Alteromonas sp. 009811495]